MDQLLQEKTLKSVKTLKILTPDNIYYLCYMESHSHTVQITNITTNSVVHLVMSAFTAV